MGKMIATKIFEPEDRQPLNVILWGILWHVLNLLRRRREANRSRFRFYTGKTLLTIDKSLNNSFTLRTQGSWRFFLGERPKYGQGPHPQWVHCCLTELLKAFAPIWGATSFFQYISNSSASKLSVHITSSSLLHPDCRDYSFILTAFKVTFSALYVYSEELAGSGAQIALESPVGVGGGRQRTFREKNSLLRSLWRPSCWRPSFPLSTLCLCTVAITCSLENRLVAALGVHTWNLPVPKKLCPVRANTQEHAIGFSW